MLSPFHDRRQQVIMCTLFTRYITPLSTFISTSLIMDQLKYVSKLQETMTQYTYKKEKVSKYRGKIIDQGMIIDQN